MKRIRPVSLSRYRAAIARRLMGPTPVVRSDPEARRTVRADEVFPESPTDLVPRRFKFDLRDLIGALPQEIDFWWLADRNTSLLRLGSAGDEATYLLDAVLRAASENGFAIQVRDRRTNQRLKCTVRNTHQLLQRDSMVRLVLVDRRSDYPPMAVLIEKWRQTPEGHLSSPSNNHAVSRLWKSTLESTKDRAGARPLLQFLQEKPTDYTDFDVDWVFSWVNGDDPDWQQLYSQWAPGVQSDATDRSRFATRDDLRFALRSIDQFAPWVRKIFVFTNWECCVAR